MLNNDPMPAPKIFGLNSALSKGELAR